MRTALIVALIIVIALFATASIVLDRKLLDVFAFGLMLLLALTLRRLGRPWWLPSLLFALLGASHLLAIWWLRFKGSSSASSPALETFGPGYLLMAALFFLRGLWPGKTHA